MSDEWIVAIQFVLVAASGAAAVAALTLERPQILTEALPAPPGIFRLVVPRARLRGTGTTPYFLLFGAVGAFGLFIGWITHDLNEYAVALYAAILALIAGIIVAKRWPGGGPGPKSGAN